LIKSSEDGVVTTVIHIDGCFTIGHKKAIGNVINQIRKKGLDLKLKDNLKDYLGCEIYVNKDILKAWIRQQLLVNVIERIFIRLVK
jgi:hypothetical protein